jgi:hypothetical protein
MHHAGAIPKQHISPGYFVDIGPRFLSGAKMIGCSFGKLSTTAFRITAGTDHIAQRFDTGAAVDITHHHMIRVLFFEFFE